MKIIILVCRKCGHRKRIEFYEAEEARARNIRTMPITACCCERCGSFDLDHD